MHNLFRFEEIREVYLRIVSRLRIEWDECMIYRCQIIIKHVRVMFYEGVSYFIIHLLKYSISVYIIYSDNWPVRWWQGLEPMQWNSGLPVPHLNPTFSSFVFTFSVLRHFPSFQIYQGPKYHGRIEIRKKIASTQLCWGIFEVYNFQVKPPIRSFEFYFDK